MHRFTRAGIACASVLLASGSSLADVWFTHDDNVIALPPTPPNGVFASPDVQDIFFSSAFIRTAPGPNLGNLLVVNNPVHLGLLPGDNIDAIHHELRELGDSYDEFPAYVFSVDSADVGLPGTAVRSQVPDNAGDLYESNGFGYNTTDVNENQIGLAPGITVDVDGVFLTPASEIDPARWIYFSLTPGSPSLTALGASPGDILAAQLGGSPVVSITGKQLGLEGHDDIDGLIMFHGVDANGDGDFDDDADTFPYVVFSVSNLSTGLPGTSVNFEALTDFPVGGDIYSSIGYEQNALIMDDGQFGLGLDDKDNVDSLDLPSMAVPSTHPLGTPFTGGFTTPGGPGTPGGPAIPPPGGSGGPPGCTPMASIRFGLCVTAYSSRSCDVEIRVFISCNTPGLPSTLTTGKVTVPCDKGDGKGVRLAIQKLRDELQKLKIPGPPGSSPDAGKPLFAPGAGGGAGIATFPPGGPITHANAQLDVNGMLTDCKVTGFATILCDCHCYTQNVRVMSWEHKEKTLIDWGEPGRMSVELNAERIDPGVYMMQFEQDEHAHFIETQGGAANDVSRELMRYFDDLGYKTQLREDERGFNFLADPFERPVAEIWGAGFVDGGTGEHALSFQAVDVEHVCRCDLNGDLRIDVQDIMMFLEYFKLDDPVVDFDQSGSIDFLDLSEMLTNMGDC